MSKYNWTPKSTPSSFSSGPHLLEVDPSDDPLYDADAIAAAAKAAQAAVEAAQRAADRATAQAAKRRAAKEAREAAKSAAGDIRVGVAAVPEEKEVVEEEVFDPLADPLMNPLADTGEKDPLADDDESGNRGASAADHVTDEEHSSFFDELVPWATRSPAILAKYTTTESLDVSAEFMAAGDGNSPAASQASASTPSAASSEAAEGGAAPAVRTADEQVKARLEELDDSAETRAAKRLAVTQKDYIAHIAALRNELIRAWDAQERVKSLKIAIQCAKVLGDTSVIKFYPSKYVLITDILDTFGRLVYNRIRDRAGAKDDLQEIESPQEFQRSGSTATGAALEVCRNWFYKIASIRELLPRIYVELAIIASYRFIGCQPFSQLLTRLSRAIRGVGDPLVAQYARVYLIRMALIVEPNPSVVRNLIVEMSTDFAATMKPMLTEEAKLSQRAMRLLDRSRVNPEDYFDLYTPALEYMYGTGSQGGGEAIVQRLLTSYESGPRLASVLAALLSSLPPDVIGRRGAAVLEYAVDADRDSYPKRKLWATLGAALCVAPEGTFGDEAATIQFLERAREVLGQQLRTAEDFAVGVEAWIDLPLKFGTPDDVDAQLGDLLARVGGEDRAYESLQSYLGAVVGKVVTLSPDLREPFGMQNFLPLLDLFEEEMQVDVSKSVMEAFLREATRQEKAAALVEAALAAENLAAAARGEANPTDVTAQEAAQPDPLLVASLVAIGKNVHDSLNTLSFEDDVRRISNSLAAFISRIDYGRDVEKQLTFYVDCRSAFGNLDPVKGALVQGAVRLVERTRAVVGGRHTRKTAAFTRACLAFAFVTIPSMDDPMTRLRLYRLAAEVALTNGALPQFDALVRGALQLVPEVSATDNDDLLAMLQSFVSLLIAAPGHPDNGPFYLLKGLLGVERERDWPSHRPHLYLSVLRAVSAMCQTKLPYKSPDPAVRGNDELYGRAPSYLAAAQEIVDAMLEDLLTAIAAERERNAPRRQAQLALDVFDTTVELAELNAKSATLAYNLFSMAYKVARDQQFPQITKRLGDSLRLLESTSQQDRPDSRKMAQLHQKLQQAIAA
jgi:hypothetical protein